MIKCFLNILFLLSISYNYSQEKFAVTPKNATEIHFVYQVTSNYFINDDGVFADTLLFKIDFPDLKYTLKKHPKDSLIICGFSKLKKFDNIKKLRGILYHTNQTFYGIHFIYSKKTVFNVVRGDEETRMIYKKYFKERFVDFEYRQEFDFVKKTENIKYPNVHYDFTFDEIMKKIEFKNNENIGSYYETIRNFYYKNIVSFNNNLSKFISPYIFENNNFGIEKIEKLGSTITLKSVSYK